MVEEESLDEAKDRLVTLLEALPSNPPIPVQVISTDDDAEIAEITEELGLDQVKAEGKIKSFQVTVMNADIFCAGNMGKNKKKTEKPEMEPEPEVTFFFTSGALNTIVTDLAGSAPAPPIQFLDVKPLMDFVQDFLCSTVSSEIYDNHKNRMAKKLCHQVGN